VKNIKYEVPLPCDCCHLSENDNNSCFILVILLERVLIGSEAAHNREKKWFISHARIR
jgi:hypothetical protein